ncbi:MAG TPA: hypothetical protein VND45_17470 [Thermoanaerobaculia bacterium]|nr:hypothetical protein [Thermoanaerobaculia bacterium]
MVFVPGSRKGILARHVARRPWAPIARGDELRAARKTVRVTGVEMHLERRGDIVEHRTEIFTRAVVRKRPRKVPAERVQNVIRMPTGDGSVVAEFIRYHVLVRVFDGDADAWLAHLRASGDPGGDLRFVRWIRSRLRQEPRLIISIRAMVDATPFWRAAEA